MISLDSTKISVRNESLKNYKSLEFETKTSFNKEKNQKRSVDIWNKSNILGLKYIGIGESETQLEFSAKILKQNYLSGINLNTQEQLVNEINKTGLIEFDVNGFLENAIVYRTDITDNIKPKNIEKTLLDLKIFSANRFYDIKPHHTGVVITSKHKRDKERLVIYDKYSEVSKPLKANKELEKVFDINQAKNVLRIESNNKSFKRIRTNLDFLNNKTPYLQDVLQSERKANYNIFTKMFEIKPESKTKTYGVIQMLLELGYKQHQIEKELGMRAIVESCNYDFEAIKTMLNMTTKGRNPRKEQQYRKLIEIMRLEKLDYDTSSIQEIEQLLQAV